MIATIPFDNVSEWYSSSIELNQKFNLVKMLKAVRVLKLSRMITYLNVTDDFKLSLRLFKVCFFLILYLNISACVWFYACMSLFNEKQSEYYWTPAQFKQYDVIEDFYTMDTYTKYSIAFYDAVLGLMGNDIYPSGLLLFPLASTLLVMGAFINANIFGTIAVIAQTINMKAMKF